MRDILAAASERVIGRQVLLPAMVPKYVREFVKRREHVRLEVQRQRESSHLFDRFELKLHNLAPNDVTKVIFPEPPEAR